MVVTILLTLVFCAISTAALEDEECGVVSELEPLLAWGRNASAKEFPWHVGVYSWDALHGTQQICGGTLVRPSLVVTAAHCFDHLDGKYTNPQNVTIAAGKLYRPIINGRDGTQQQSEVDRILVPDSYDGSWTNFQDDIAVAILKHAFTYNGYIRPICLDFDRELDNAQLSQGNMGKVVGWGLTEKNTPSRVLRVVELPVITLRACRELSDNRQYLTNDKFCAGFTDGTAAVCRGDSGGGLVFARRLDSDGAARERYYLRGVVSVALKPRDLSRLCNLDVAAMFTRVTAPQHERFLKDAIAQIEAQNGDKCPAVRSGYAPSRSPQKSWNKCIEFQSRLVIPCVTFNNAGVDHWARNYGNCPFDTESSPTRGTDEVAAAVAGKLPYMVQLMTNNTATAEFKLYPPGTLLNEKFILTSAWNVNNNAIKWARIRPHASQAGVGGSLPRRDVYEISRAIPHPDYRPDDLEQVHDIALLETKHKMLLSLKALPACLDVDRGVDYNRVLIMGWYNEEKQKRTPEPGVFATCDKPDEDPLVMQCYSAGAASSDCWNTYYRGSASVVRNKEFGCMYTVVGILTRYSGCSGPLFYTRLSNYVDWIENYIW